jgi:hypothetical protein
MEETNEEIIGYCHYCKEEIRSDDEHVYKNGNGIAKLYHIACWKLQNNITEEVEFDNEVEG